MLRAVQQRRPNPREPKTSSRVSKKIKETLENNPQNFHLLNRGITIVAKAVRWDNKSNRVHLNLADADDEQLYGILDGGNTNERIKLWKEDLDDETAAELLPHTFVNVQVLVPLAKGDFGPSPAMESLLNDIKEARNTSVQVSEKSLADARHHFDQLKAALDKESYSNRIIWHEGQKGSIDALELIGLLMIFFPHYSDEAAGGEPHGLYGRKQHALDSYLKFTEGQHRNELMKWINVLPDLVTLFDHIQNTLPDKYEGHFGRIREVKIYDESKLEKGRKYRKTPGASAIKCW